MGPVVDQYQFDSVMKGIEAGKGQGARLLAGGGKPEGGAFARGYFVAPTVFGNVTPSMHIAQEEIFGPVLAIIPVAGEAEALAAANDSKYGLSSSIFTNDINAAMRFCERIEVGIVHVNSPTVGGEAHLPFGGMKATGVGEREMGKTAIEFYSQWKTVYIDYTGARRASKIY
jgi:aldehyde dehydrogenase (NAD+)